MALLAFSHTQVEHRLYLAMLHAVRNDEKRIGCFGIRYLMKLTRLSSYSSIRRGCLGLIQKLSMEMVNDSSAEAQMKSVYRVLVPEEIFARRRAAGLEPYPKEVRDDKASNIFDLLIQRLATQPDLSRREALVALYCASGLSNAEIGQKLCISEKTVKYHLRHVYIKLGVKRRTELVSCLLNAWLKSAAGVPPEDGRAGQ